MSTNTQQNPNQFQNNILKRDILNAAVNAQTALGAANQELARQGEHLKRSLGRSNQIANEQTRGVKQALDALLVEARRGKLSQLVRLCCCCHCLRSPNIVNEQNEYNIKDFSNSKSPVNWDDTELNPDRLLPSSKPKPGEPVKDKGSSWKKTLAPPPGESNDIAADIWYRQIDLSLTELQRVAEQMGRSIEDQNRMAQMLTIYLNLGVDQVTGLNETLMTEKALS